MSSRVFLVALMAVGVCVHLLRFPHLILENGGGAFLILFFLCLNLVSFPVLIAERILDDKLNEIDLRSLIYIRKEAPVGLLDRGFIFIWFGLRTLLLILFFWFFLYLGSSALVYMFYFLRTAFEYPTSYSDVPTVPEINFSWLGSLFWSLLIFFVFLLWDGPFLKFFARWVLPFCFGGLFLLLMRVIFKVNEFEGLKNLFYPDFKALTAGTLNSLIGHSLVSLFIGFGFYKQYNQDGEKLDVIELFVRVTTQCLILAIVIGVMALPMIEQISETPFGSNWVFQILPRWLSYGEFGSYYCSLFFLAISILCVYVAISLLTTLDANVKLILNFKGRDRFRWTINTLFILCSSGVVLLLQNRMQGWSGQSYLISIDSLVVNHLVPFFALMMIWVVFRYTREHERFEVFKNQHLFFHSRSFFNLWEFVTIYFVPATIIAGWVFLYFS